MKSEQIHETVSVDLPLSCVYGLLALSDLMDDSVTEALQRAISTDPMLQFNSSNERPTPKTTASIARHKQVVAEILGRQVAGRTLPDLFGNCVDLLHDLEPGALERFSEVKTSARRYVARRREDIHFKSRHLVDFTFRTASGWWISTNVSAPQMTTALRLLTKAAGLNFGRDVIFPLC